MRDRRQNHFSGEMFRLFAIFSLNTRASRLIATSFKVNSPPVLHDNTAINYHALNVRPFSGIDQVRINVVERNLIQ
jgi:hypothetical protein